MDVNLQNLQRDKEQLEAYLAAMLEAAARYDWNKAEREAQNFHYFDGLRNNQWANEVGILDVFARWDDAIVEIRAAKRAFLLAHPLPEPRPIVERIPRWEEWD